MASLMEIVWTEYDILRAVPKVILDEKDKTVRPLPWSFVVVSDPE